MKKLTLILLFYSCNLFALNRGEIRTQIRNLIGDATAYVTVQRWSNDILNTRIEMAQLDIVRKSKCLEKTTYYYVHYGTRTYTLPTDYLAIARVEYFVKGTTDIYKKIDRYTLLGLDNWNIYWQQLGKGLPEKYYLWANSIGLVPVASNDYKGTDKLKINYIAQPISMTGDSDIPFNSIPQLYPYHDLIIWYVMEMCKSDDNKKNEATSYFNKYYTLLRIMSSEFQEKDDWWPDLGK